MLQKLLEEIVRMKHYNLETQENNDIFYIIDQIKVTSVPLWIGSAGYRDTSNTSL